MSGFQELIKSFPKTREYVRDFFVYGFKTREEFREKSPRTYDNERRRLESWLGDYVRKDHVSKGSNISQGISISQGINISLAIDSNLLDTNPLFQVWKTKSFTDNDIVLHFLILDLLQDGRELTAEEITEQLLAEYEALFDVQTVRRKCNAYEKEGLLQKRKAGKIVVYSLDLSLARWFKSNDSLWDALAFYQMAECFGIVGNYLTDQFDCCNQSFRVKHSFCVHTLEDEILLTLLDAMNQKTCVHLEMKSSKSGRANAADCTPLQIFTSTRSGRRFLCGHVQTGRRFTCYRLDTIRAVTLLQPSPEYDELLSKLERNRKHLWGVSFQGSGSRHLEKLTMTVQVNEPYELYIVNRLRQEGRHGTVTKLEPGVYQYEIEVFDCNEMLPWVRTFIGRILSFQCSSRFVEQRFHQDLQAMYRMYQIDDLPISQRSDNKTTDGLDR